MRSDSFTLIIRDLQNILKNDRDGASLQWRMAPFHRPRPDDLLKAYPDARLAAVLALLLPHPDDGDVSVLLMERSAGPSDVHAGQISFPGGSREPGEDLYQTALRETFEEVGVLPSSVSHIAGLTPLYIPPSNFLVHPFLAYSEKTPDFVISTKEVNRLFHVHLRSFIDQNNILIETFPARSGSLVTAPCFKIDGHRIWGATAMMLSELSELYRIVI